jgi:O-6-methylguanine DNA methyltransferase
MAAEPQGRMMAFASGGFDPSNIISDYNFFDSWAMTESEIQAFLEREGNPCGNSNCLANFRVNTPNASWDFGTCAPYAGAANESAARIIFKVQRACGLSAKVILVTLQKEQGLITASRPSDLVMRKAMGMACPDTSECDAAYYGFFNQIYAAARRVGWGNTTTYGTLAKQVGAGPEVARNVGQAMAKNPVPLIIPCHRVLAAGGKLGGFSAPGGSATKERMLALEGSLAPPPPTQQSLGL